jgi:hypothetical protein
MTKPKPKPIVAPVPVPTKRQPTNRRPKGRGTISWEEDRQGWRAAVMIDGVRVRERHTDEAFLERWLDKQLGADEAQANGEIDTTK